MVSLVDFLMIMVKKKGAYLGLVILVNLNEFAMLILVGFWHGDFG